MLLVRRRRRLHGAGVYDMGPSFGADMAKRGVSEASEIGGLPSWSVLLRRCPAAGCPAAGAAPHEEL